MALPMTREKALKMLKEFNQKESDMNHYLESEAVMRSLAEKFREDVEYWGMLGLLHDVDWAFTRENWKDHAVKAVEIYFLQPRTMCRRGSLFSSPHRFCFRG